MINPARRHALPPSSVRRRDRPSRERRLIFPASHRFSPNPSPSTDLPRRSPSTDSKTFKKPRRPFEKERLDSELKVVGEYGLRNKRELWRVQFALNKLRNAARVLLTLDEKDPKRIFEGEAIMRRMYRYGLLVRLRSPFNSPFYLWMCGAEGEASASVGPSAGARKSGIGLGSGAGTLKMLKNHRLADRRRTPSSPLSTGRDPGQARLRARAQPRDFPRAPSPDDRVQARPRQVCSPRARADQAAPHSRRQADRERSLLPRARRQPEAHRLLAQLSSRWRPPGSRQAQEAGGCRGGWWWRR